MTQRVSREGRWRAGYSERVHQRLLDKHAGRWEEMHSYGVKHGHDETYETLRAGMLESSHAITRYWSKFYRPGRWPTR